MLALVALFLAAAASVSAHQEMPVNPALGVPGFPDCTRAHPERELSVEEAALDLDCRQRLAPASAVKIACVGDSITAGVHSSGGNHTYPAQLQILLDQAYGKGAYSVTNLGACGSTMLKGADSPYWNRGQYKALTGNTWDIVVIMLGTNDAKRWNWPTSVDEDSSDSRISATNVTTLTLQSKSDFKFSGTNIDMTPGLPKGALRSGTPGHDGVAASHMLLTPGSMIESLSFSYRYVSGYGPAGKGVGTNFSVRANGQVVYASPHYTDYAYDQNRTNFSAPVRVDVSGLSIAVPKKGISRLEFDFANNDRNLELLLPLSITLTCTGADACTTKPPPACGPDGASLSNCDFADDYKSMIDKVRTLGNTPAGPKIYAMIPPPLMKEGAYGMSEAVINSVFPKLVPLIQKDAGVLGPIDVFASMGGVADWKDKYPAGGCGKTTTQPQSCHWYCDDQSCDQCHPNNDGYTQLAKTVLAGLGLSSAVVV